MAFLEQKGDQPLGPLLKVVAKTGGIKRSDRGHWTSSNQQLINVLVVSIETIATLEVQKGGTWRDPCQNSGGFALRLPFA